MSGGHLAGVARLRSAESRVALTRRERQVLELLAADGGGNTNHTIGRSLWLTEQTVKFHLSNIYRKLQVRNRTEAILEAQARGLVMREGGALVPVEYEVFIDGIRYVRSDAQ